jgi:hypothetical protein
MPPDISSGVSIAPHLSAAGAGAALQEVANTSPIFASAVATACERQARGLLRTRNATLYATGELDFTAAAGGMAAGQAVDIFNVPIGQTGSGFGDSLTKAQTNMVTASQLTSESFTCQKMGITIDLDEADGAETAFDIAALLTWCYSNLVAEVFLGAQDVQLLGVLGQWPDLAPQVVNSATTFVGGYTTSGATAPAEVANTAPMLGYRSNGWDSLRPYDLVIPVNTTFKMRISTPAVSAFGGAVPTATGSVRVRVSMYGVSATAIQA